MKIMITHDFFGGVLSVWICVFEKLLTHSRKVHHHCGYRGCYRERCGAAGSGGDKKNHFILAIWKLLFSSFIHIMVSSWYVAGSIMQVYFVRALAECLLPYFPSSRKNQVLFEGERMCIVGIKEHTSEFKMSIGYWFLLFSRGLAARQSGFVPDMYLR